MVSYQDELQAKKKLIFLVLYKKMKNENIGDGVFASFAQKNNNKIASRKN